jgi:hypothetical protein
MTNDHTQARLQRIEDHLRSLDERVSVLSAVDSGAAKKRIAETFGSDPRMVIIYRGVQAGVTQQGIADALRSRNLTGAQQARVSNAFTQLEDLGFIAATPKGKFLPVGGWESFGIERVLKRTLRNNHVDDLE